MGGMEEEEEEGEGLTLVLRGCMEIEIWQVAHGFLKIMTNCNRQTNSKQSYACQPNLSKGAH